jgi:hypothetical protein
MPDADELGSYRWTLLEYVLRCEQGRDLREIVVEGVIDRDFISRVVQDWRPTVNVLESDYLNISHEDIDTAGFTYGAKGKLLTLAKYLDKADEKAGCVQRAAVVVDRDYEEREEDEDSVLLLTDGYSIESYAMNAETLQRFSEQVLGRAPRPPGAGGAAPGRYSCTGQELYERIREALIELASVRMTLREAMPPLKIFKKWLQYATVDADGVVTVEGDRLLKNILISGGRGELEGELGAVRIDKRTIVVQNPSRWIRGHDFVEVLEKVLNSRWGKRRNGKAVIGDDSNHLTRLLLFSIDPQALTQKVLFQRLKMKFG